MTYTEEVHKWDRLLSCRRINDILESKEEQECKTEPRNPYERDCDRITYSYPFRRLQNKTQVIPLPVLDFIHTRLTHTLEVTTVGRSLGRILESYLLGKKVIQDHQRGDIPAIVAAACLAHDIGNPPFGHSGEYSIAESFQSSDRSGHRFGLHGDHFGSEYTLPFGTKAFTDNEVVEAHIKLNDLRKFEGNAMGFRILTTHDGKGLNLTCATLAAFTKYPRLSFIREENEVDNWKPERVSQKKYGVFLAEREIF